MRLAIIDDEGNTWISPTVNLNTINFKSPENGGLPSFNYGVEVLQALSVLLYRNESNLNYGVPVEPDGYFKEL